MFKHFLISILLVSTLSLVAQPYDVIFRNGTIYDGTGNKPYVADVAIRGDTLAKIGALGGEQAKQEFDCKGKAVAPGFINMLSWADGTLLKDGRALSDLKQGVTLEIFGEGISPGPRHRSRRSKLWTTLGGYFKHLEQQGVSVNFASLVGATTIRSYVIGSENRRPTKDEMRQMKSLVRQAMEQGALGIGSSLIYAPATFASTQELIELCKVASSYSGIYMTHMRSESDKILQALNETFRIASAAKLPVEIWHLKINHERNWKKIDLLLAKIDSARGKDLRVSANMYPYTVSATGLKERIPVWAQEGGMKELRKRIRTPETRKKILHDMAKGVPTKNSDPWEVVILGFRKDSLSELYKGKRLDEVAKLHGASADETVLDLIYADKTSVPALYFLMSENNMRRMLQQPYVSIGSDAGGLAVTDEFKDLGTHPRAYGTFARVLGKYSRDEKLFPLEEAVHKMTGLPAANTRIKRRGLLKPGYFADVVVFDPLAVRDVATFEDPHQYSIGVEQVFVNGVQVLKNGEPTEARPGRLVPGPGLKSK